jgi:hypothetical protein
MITILRKHHRWLMIVIAILAIPFVFYFNKTDLGASRSTDLGRIYDRPITQVEFTRNARLMNLANGLGLSLVNDLMTANVASEGEMYVEFTWNRLTFRHEAERLGIRPSSSEITAFVKTLPRFRGDGGFDMNKYTEFTKVMLPSLGFNQAQVEELVSDQLSLNRVKDLLGTSVQVPETESQENYERAYGKMDVAVVRLRDEDFQKDVIITDDEIAKYYEAHKAQLKSEEKRRVEFVTFALTVEEKKLTGKERVEALQKVADRANDFSQALIEKDAKFAEIAGKSQTPVATTGEFTAAAPDPQLAANPQSTQYAFQLTQEAPFSDPIQGPDGFLVLHLLGKTEARPLSLEEAKPKITDTLKSERLRDIVSKKGAEVAGKIREALKSGTPLETVAQQGGLKLERIPAFSLVETSAPKPETPKDVTPKDPTPKSKDAKSKSKDAKPKDEKPPDVKPPDVKPKDETPDLSTIKNAVAALNPGEVTDFVPVEKGGLVAALEKRAPADPSGYAVAKAQFESRYLMQRRGAVFVEWLRDRRRAAGVSVATG